MKVYKFPLGALQTNCYVGIANDNKNCFVVDPAIESKELINFIDSNKLELKAILLTHGHFDHIGGVAYLKSIYPNAVIYMSKNDENKILNTQISRTLKIDVDVDKFSIDQYVQDGTIINVGDCQITAMLTAGHSAGGVCYIVDNNIFCGDTLFKNGYGRVDFIDGSLEMIIQSIERVFGLQGDYILRCGHGEDSTLEYERKHNPILRYL